MTLQTNRMIEETYSAPILLLQTTRRSWLTSMARSPATTSSRLMVTGSATLDVSMAASGWPLFTVALSSDLIVSLAVDGSVKTARLLISLPRCRARI